MKTWKQFLAESNDMAPMQGNSMPGGEGEDNVPAEEAKSKLKQIWDAIANGATAIPRTAVELMDELLTLVSGSPTAPF